MGGDHVPIKVLKERNDLPWMTYAVKNLIKRRKRIYKTAKTTNNESDWKVYKSLQVQIKAEIKRAHDIYLEGMFEHNDGQINTKRLWAYIKLKLV